MKTPLLAAALLLAGCATTRPTPGSARGFATESTMGCASLVLEQRGYTASYFPRRRELRAEKAFRSGSQDMVVHAIIIARLEPAPDARPVLAVRSERRFGAPSQDPRRSGTGRLLPSAYFESGVVDEDARTVVEQCTTGRAPD